MSNCTAKVTTADVTDEVVTTSVASSVGRGWMHAVPDGATVQRQGDQLVRVDLHELECFHGEPERWHTSPGGLTESGARWTDDTPGATPHTDDVCPTCGGSGDDEDPEFFCPRCDGTGRTDDVTVSDAEQRAAYHTFLYEMNKDGGRVWTEEERRHLDGALKTALQAAKRAEREQT